jgi:riboflavin-specific deaminase-like protein
MVGIGTVLKDDPHLNVRLASGSDPLRVVIDSRLRIPLAAKVLSDDLAKGTLVIAGEGASQRRARRIESAGATVLFVPADEERRVSLVDALYALSERGIRSVLVEGGAALITSLLSLRLVDRMIVLIAPKILGQGIEAIGDLGTMRLTDAVNFSSVRIRRLGPDVIFDCLI